MSWSWRVGRVLGIDVYVHFTFLLLLGWVLLIHYFLRQDLGDGLEESLFIVVVFSTVLLHEFGHALAARRYGIPTRDITLLPIGGVARLERMPEDPKQELVVALAGPAVNVVLAAGLYLWLTATAAPPALVGHFAEFTDSLAVRLFHVNVLLAIFNMLPAFLMDGGRVLRAPLTMRLDYVQATQIAASVGQGMALLFGFFGLFGNPLLLFIALFVWIGASQEASMVLMKSSLTGIPVSRAMVKNFRTLAPDELLEHTARRVAEGYQQDFPVVEGGRVVGVLTRPDLLSALADHGERVAVRDVMRRQFDTVHPSEMLDSALLRLQSSRCHLLPVVHDGTLVGVVTMENVGEFLSVQAARRAPRLNGREECAR